MIHQSKDLIKIKSTKRDNQTFYNPIRRGILNYQMIEPGDRIAVGMSGGKDSTSLLYFLDIIRKQKRLGFDFELVPITLDMGMNMDLVPLKQFIEKLGYSLEIVPTDIAKVVFDIRQEKNPCSLCAKLRRGILYKRAKELGCQKVALGHHLDDAIETYFMNFFFHGRMTSFDPKRFLSQNGIHLIRPLIYLKERDIIRFVGKENLPIIFNPCPVDKKTKREEIKVMVRELAKTYPNIREKFIRGMEQGNTYDFWHPTN